MKLYFKDLYSTYSIQKHRDGTATVKGRNCYGQLMLNRRCKSVLGAKQVMSRFNGGMPELVKK